MNGKKYYGQTKRVMAHVMIMAVLVIVLGIHAQPASAQVSQWTVTASAKAQVLLPGGTWQTLDTETRLVPGAEVKVAPGGRVVLAQNGDFVTLSPNSHMKLPVSGKASEPSILQKLGTLLYKIRKRNTGLLHSVSKATSTNRPFKVDTPYLAAVIKGTVFSVNVSAQGAALHVTEGLVEAISQATGERGLVSPGQTARVSSLAGAGLSISHGGKVKGKAGNSGTASDGGKKDGDAKAGNGKGPGTSADKGLGTAAAAGNNGQRGLQVAVSNGALDVSISSKGLLNAVATSNITRAGSFSHGKGNGALNGKGQTPGQMMVGYGGNFIPGGGPGGNNGKKGNNGKNGCNGKGKKPGC